MLAHRSLSQSLSGPATVDCFTYQVNSTIVWNRGSSVGDENCAPGLGDAVLGESSTVKLLRTHPSEDPKG